MLYKYKICYNTIYTNKNKYFIAYSFKLNDYIIKAEDFDWKNKNLTVYSSSKNKLKNYKDIYFNINKKLYKNLYLLLTFNYKLLDMYWFDTKETDFIQNSTSYYYNKSLNYSKRMYLYNFGIKYIKKLSNTLFINFQTSYILGFVNSKDEHILRNFYTTQNSKVKGYNILVSTIYNINSYTNLHFKIKYETFKDNNIDMNYYTNYDYKYQTLNSSYFMKNTIFSLSYEYIF